MQTVGFVGAGLMGAGMARNIMQAGYALHVIAHRNRAPIDTLVSQGAIESASLGGLAETCDVIHICAPGSPQVEAILEEMLPNLRAGSVIIDCSTADPVSTQALSDKLNAKDCHMIDAPLGGTPIQAEAGELTAMIGADEAILAQVKPIIDSWSASSVHMGPPASGHKMKLLNNMLSLGYGALYSEALALAAKVGISVGQFDSIIRGSRMDCGFYQTFMGYAVEGNPESHKFTLKNALKDMTYLENMANSVGMANPVGNTIKGSLGMAVSAGANGPTDYLPTLVDHVAARNGVKLAKPETR